MVMPLASLALLLIILVKVSSNLKQRSRQYFFVTVIILTLWNLGDLLYPGLDDYNLSKLILNAILILISMVPTFFGLSVVSLYKKPKGYELALFMLSLLIIPIIIISPFELRSTEFGWQPIYSEDPIFPLWITMLFITFLYACANMVKVMSALKDKESRKRVMYMLVGSLLGIAFGVIVIVLSVGLDMTPLPVGSFGMVIFTLSMFLAYFR